MSVIFQIGLRRVFWVVFLRRDASRRFFRPRGNRHAESPDRYLAGPSGAMVRRCSFLLSHGFSGRGDRDAAASPHPQLAKPALCGFEEKPRRPACAPFSSCRRSSAPRARAVIRRLRFLHRSGREAVLGSATVRAGPGGVRGCAPLLGGRPATGPGGLGWRRGWGERPGGRPGGRSPLSGILQTGLSFSSCRPGRVAAAPGEFWRVRPRGRVHGDSLGKRPPCRGRDRLSASVPACARSAPRGLLDAQERPWPSRSGPVETRNGAAA